MDRTVNRTLAIKYFSGLCTHAEIITVNDWLKDEANERQFETWIWEDWVSTQGAMPADASVRLKSNIDNQLLLARQEPVLLRISWLRYSVAAAVLILLVLGGISVFQSRNDSSVQVNGTVAYTDSIVNNNKTPLRTLLADGSTVWLNSGASLYIASGFNRMERKVKVEGEAFFDIKQDASRPFYAIAGNITTHVLGTSYNMEAYPSEKQLRISLLSGSVVVRNDDTSCLLHPGQMAVYGKQSKDMLVEPTAAADPTAWITGKIVMNRISLEDALHRLARLYDVPIEYDEQIVKGKFITGEFDRDKLPVVLESILFVHHLKLSPMSKGGYHISGDAVKK